MKSAELTGFKLFNLKDDIAEQNDVSKMHAEVLQRLRDQMEEMYREVRDEGPVWPAWEFARYEAQRIEWPDYWVNRNRAKK